MSKITNGTGKGVSKNAPMVVTLPFSVGKLIAIAPIMIVGSIILGLYFSGIIQFMLGVRELKEDGHEAKAIEYFNWALSGNPFFAEAYEQRARASLSLEKQKGLRADYSASQRDIDRAIKLNPNKFQYFDDSLEIEHAAQNYHKELERCSQKLAIFEWDSDRSLTKRADVEYLVGDFKNERADRENLIKTYTDDLKSLKTPSRYHTSESSRGAQYRYLGQVENAIRDFETCAKTPESFDLISLGYLYEHSGRYSKAIDAYSKVIEVEKKDTSKFCSNKAHSRRAQLYFKSGQNEKALADLNYLDTKEADASNVNRRTAFREKVLEAMGRKAQAAALKQHTLQAFNVELNKNDPEAKSTAYSSRGEYYEAEGEWKKALADYSIALSTSTKPMTLRFTDCARMYTKLGDYDKAIAFFSKGLLPNSDNYDAERVYNGLAEVHLLQHKPELALEDSTKAIAQEGHTDGEASSIRARALRQLGKNDLAKVDENEALGMEFSPSPDIY